MIIECNICCIDKWTEVRSSILAVYAFLVFLIKFLAASALPPEFPSMITKPSLTILYPPYYTKSQWNFPPPTRLCRLSSMSYLFLANFIPFLPSLPPHASFLSSSLSPSAFQSSIPCHASPLIFLFPCLFPFSLLLSSLCLCLFSQLLLDLDTVSETQIMSDIYKTGLARITFTHAKTSMHTNTNDSMHPYANLSFSSP